MTMHARAVRLTWISLCAVLALALPSTAAAQSGSPGAAGADDAVYGPPQGPGILGEEPGQGAGSDPADAATAIPVAGVDPAEAAGSGSGSSSDVRSIPFTGLALALLVVAGVGLFAAGGGLRLVGRARA